MYSYHSTPEYIHYPPSIGCSPNSDYAKTLSIDETTMHLKGFPYSKFTIPQYSIALLFAKTIIEVSNSSI